MGILEAGKLNNTPFVYVDGFSHTSYISKMINGRPAPESVQIRWIMGVLSLLWQNSDVFNLTFTSNVK